MANGFAHVDADNVAKVNDLLSRKILKVCHEFCQVTDVSSHCEVVVQRFMFVI